MTHEERYLFDLQGFLVIRSALSPSLLARLQHAVETMEDLNDAEAASRGAISRKSYVGTHPREHKHFT